MASDVAIAAADPEHRAGRGAVLLSETLFAILPGADLVPEFTLSRADAFETLRAALLAFRELGGTTIVDLGGLTTGRDAELLELLETTTGVEIVASTGFGPAWTVGSHFTNNVSPEGMTVERIVDIFARELRDGLLVPTRERLARRAGIVSFTQTAAGAPPLPRTKGGPTIEADSLRASARAARDNGAVLAVRVADRPEELLGPIAEEGLAPERTLVLGLDRVDHAAAGLPRILAEQGYVVGLDHVGWPAEAGYLDDTARVRLVLDLFADGLGDRLIVSSSAIGVAVELPAPVRGDFTSVLREFVPAFLAAGGTRAQLDTLLVETPHRTLAPHTLET